MPICAPLKDRWINLSEDVFCSKNILFAWILWLLFNDANFFSLRGALQKNVFYLLNNDLSIFNLGLFDFWTETEWFWSGLIICSQDESQDSP